MNLKWFRPLYFPILLPVALLIALYNKLSPIPFKIYVLRVDRVGQLAANQEEFCCHRDLGMLPKEYRVYIYRHRPSNTTLMNMWKRVLRVRQSALPLFDVCNKLGGLGITSMYIHRVTTGYDPNHLVEKTPQHIDFTQEEEREAQAQLSRLGIDMGKPMIPVLGRDSLYLKSIRETTDEDSYRNVDINTFIPAMEHLAARFNVIRMGHVAGTPLKTDTPGILDYSFCGGRTELLDIYISARCHFFFSTGTGLDSIASHCFRKPVLYVNLIPMEAAIAFNTNSLIIFKQLWHVENKRYLTLSEIFSLDIGLACTPRELSPHGVVAHDNSPEDITAVVVEMEARLDGTWERGEEGEALQARFWSHFKKKYPDSPPVSRIGTAFLRKYPHWLE
nr:TIGR04372 family glycosyltransferase [Pseudodesulfovibrio sp.]